VSTPDLSTDAVTADLKPAPGTAAPPPVLASAGTPTYLIELKIGCDPQTEDGYPERSGDYRLRLGLKRLLRGLGLRCVRVMYGRAPHGPPCPKCGSPTDDCRRCWRCFDWICLCGKLTGSALYSTCPQCALEELP
jgi:hypothetical protein